MSWKLKDKILLIRKLVVRRYRASKGTEYFLEYVNGNDMYTLYGFLRLRIPDPGSKIIFRELICKGLVRELHVYGKVLNIHKKTKSVSQHKGLGRKLLKKPRKFQTT